MEALRFTAVHEDGQHLVLSLADGTEVLLPIDARLRSALRPRGVAADTPATQLRPRDVQAMIRAGQSPEEVAEITGWPADRVARFEAPIVAEREHVAGLARAAHVRGRAPEGGIPTLESRVRERLTARGVDADNTGWDATRPEGGSWTVVVSFVAGQRQRSAAWQFDPADRTVDALDDEARWLSEDEQALPGSAAGRALLDGPGAASEEVDLITTMRERSRSRGRRKKPSTSRTDPAGLPDLADAPEQVLPLEDLPYDPETMGLPPAAHGEPEAPAGGPGAGERGSGTRESDSAAAGPGDDVDPADGTTSYDVALEFDDDYEVDTSPREATLADLFGPDEDEEFDDEDDDLEDETDDDADLEDETDEDSDDVKGESDDPVEESDDLDEESDDLDEESDDIKGESDNLAGNIDATDPDDADDEPDDGDAADDLADDGAPDPGPVSESDSDSDSDSESESEPEQPKRRKDGRPGVPSWDDIMFGAKDRHR